MTETDKDDLVVRLRLGGKVRADGGYSIPREKETMREAAAEIERLRLQLADAEATLMKLNSGEELQSLMKLNNELASQLARVRSALEVAAGRFNMMGGVGLVNGADPRVGYREAMAALTDDIGNSHE